MKAKNKTYPKINFVTREEFVATYAENKDANYVRLFHNEDTEMKRAKNGVATTFDVYGLISYDRLEHLVNLLRKEEDVYIYVEPIEGVSVPLKAAIERYHSVVHGYKTKGISRTRSSTKRYKLIYEQILTMHKRVTDEQYKNVKKWIEERDTFKYTSLTHHITILDYKAIEHNYIVRGTSSEIKEMFEGKGLIDYQMRTVSMWEADKFELPIISAFSFSKMLNYVKRPASDAFSPIFALN